MGNQNGSVPQCRFIVGSPEEGGITYRYTIVRHAHEPYTFKYSHPTNRITGFSCVPVVEGTQSPEAEVIGGGIDYNDVTILLKPVNEGKWACDIAIRTKQSSATPTEEVSQAALGAA